MVDMLYLYFYSHPRLISYEQSRVIIPTYICRPALHVLMMKS